MFVCQVFIVFQSDFTHLNILPWSLSTQAAPVERGGCHRKWEAGGWPEKAIGRWEVLDVWTGMWEVWIFSS